MAPDIKLTDTISEKQLATWYSKTEKWEDRFTELYSSLLKDYKSPMLEVNCGTGKILTALHNSGIYCDGLEASAEQLDVCNQKLVEEGWQAQLFNADFSEFTFPKKYNTIFIPNGSFCIIDEVDKAMHCLENIASALENGGTLILDIFVPWQRIISRDNKVWKVGGMEYNAETGEEFIFSYFDDFDLSAQIRTIHSKYEIFTNGEITSVRFDVSKTHWYGDNEFVMMLEKAGFGNISFRKIFENSPDDYSTLFIASKLQ